MLPFKSNKQRDRVLHNISIWSLSVILGILYLFSFQYLKLEVFYKEGITPFKGEYLYNPYTDFSPGTIKANFHAHSQSNLKLTNGHQKPSEIFEHYKNGGYDQISLSDYHRISIDKSNPDYIPVYEHGINISKTHQLVLNGGQPIFYNFSLFQNYHTRQQVINKLNRMGGLVVLAHPGLMNGYTENDMKYLRGYDFIEVLNNYYISTNIWDAALTSGYPAWILAGDDCHDISRPNLSFNNWTRIGSASPDKDAVINAMKRGCHYGFRNINHVETNYLDSCIVTGNEIKAYLRDTADRITFIADNGVVRKIVNNAQTGTYSIAQNDSYVRIEVKTGDGTLYLNPVIRYDGFHLTSNHGFALINTGMSIFVKILVLSINMLILITILYIHGRLKLLSNILKSIFAFRIREQINPVTNQI